MARKRRAAKTGANGAGNKAAGGKVNKSAEIRKVLDSGTVKPLAVVAELEKRGVTGVDTKMVSQIKNKWKKTKGKGKRGRPKATTPRAAGSSDVAGVLHLARLIRQHTIGKIRQWLNELTN